MLPEVPEGLWNATDGVSVGRNRKKKMHKVFFQSAQISLEHFKAQQSKKNGLPV